MILKLRGMIKMMMLLTISLMTAVKVFFTAMLLTITLTILVMLMAMRLLPPMMMMMIVTMYSLNSQVLP